MILILFLSIKLSILHFGVSDLGYQCILENSNNEPEIFLVQDSVGLNKLQYDTNQYFKYICEDYYNIAIGSLEEAKNYTNVIQFAVPNYYDGKPQKNFEYAGNFSKNHAMCTKTDTGPLKFDCHEKATLVSKSILTLNDGHLYNFIQTMTLSDSPNDYNYSEMKEKCKPYFQNTTNLTTVVLCLRPYDNLLGVNIHPLKLIQAKNCPVCLNAMFSPSALNLNKLLAVLTPRPCNVPTEYLVPTIFYESPYMSSENKAAFPNSMNLVPWRLLKYGFLKFIQTVGWQRVAIVTDDSEYSIDFEDELTALFSEKGIVYTAIRCEDSYCQMNKIAEELYRVQAHIVIANVEENHAHYLFQHAHRGITWLVRDLGRKRPHEYGLPHKDAAFSFSLRIDSTTRGCNVKDNIMIGLNSIAQAHKDMKNEDFKLKKRDFYRRFANNIKDNSPKITEATVVVQRLYDLEEISTMTVNASGATLIRLTNPFESGHRSDDGTAHCLVTSYRFLEPCEDPLVLLIMFTLMMFVLTALTITCYFDKTSPVNDIRYQNF